MANKIYVAPDGSWGDAEGLIIVELTEDEQNEVNFLEGREALEYLTQVAPILKVM